MSLPAVPQPPATAGGQVRTLSKAPRTGRDTCQFWAARCSWKPVEVNARLCVWPIESCHRVLPPGIIIIENGSLLLLLRIWSSNQLVRTSDLYFAGGISIIATGKGKCWFLSLGATCPTEGTIQAKQFWLSLILADGI